MSSKSIRKLLFFIVAASIALSKMYMPAIQTKASAPNAPTTVIAVVYSQPADSSGSLLQSSWWDPNGSDYDQYVWDAFTLQATQVITEIQWRGGYDPAKFGSGGPVIDFSVAIYPSIAAGIQPDVVNPPLVNYQAGDNAGETSAGTFGGTPMYNYHFILPTPFQANAGVKYWVQIEAWQHGIPDWGIAAGTGGDGKYFRRIANVGDIYYQIVPGDSAFALLGPVSNPPIAWVYLPVILSTH